MIDYPTNWDYLESEYLDHDNGNTYPNANANNNTNDNNNSWGHDND